MTKEEAARVYADRHLNLIYDPKEQGTIAFKVGWTAAMAYLSKMPLDKVIDIVLKESGLGRKERK